MTVDARTISRNYHKPHPSNETRHDMARLILALEAIDVDVHALLTAVAGRALLGHVHPIGDVTGLGDALAAKAAVDHPHALNDLTDVDTTGAATNAYLRFVAGQWVAAALEAHGHLALQISDSTEVGRAVLTAPNAATARTAIGAASTAQIQALDASAITTGTIDLARIPVLPSSVQIVSSGDLTALTTNQQNEIGDGSIVTTTDGRRWVYNGAGSKTQEASYTQLADITPEWAAIANRPATFPPSAHGGHDIADVTGLQTSLNQRLSLTGGTVTGLVTINWSSQGQLALGPSGLRVYGTATLIGFLNGSGSWTHYVDTSGNFVAVGNVSAYSDARLKTNINPLESALEAICSMRGVSYVRTDSGEPGVGVIAQEVQTVAPGVVREGSDGHLSVSMLGLVGYLVEAVKELSGRLNALEAR